MKYAITLFFVALSGTLLGNAVEMHPSELLTNRKFDSSDRVVVDCLLDFELKNLVPAKCQEIIGSWRNLQTLAGLTAERIKGIPNCPPADRLEKEISRCQAQNILGMWAAELRSEIFHTSPAPNQDPNPIDNAVVDPEINKFLQEHCNGWERFRDVARCKEYRHFRDRIQKEQQKEMNAEQELYFETLKDNRSLANDLLKRNADFNRFCFNDSADDSLCRREKLELEDLLKRHFSQLSSRKKKDLFEKECSSFNWSLLCYTLKENLSPWHEKTLKRVNPLSYGFWIMQLSPLSFALLFLYISRRIQGHWVRLNLISNPWALWLWPPCIWIGLWLIKGFLIQALGMLALHLLSIILIMAFVPGLCANHILASRPSVKGPVDKIFVSGLSFIGTYLGLTWLTEPYGEGAILLFVFAIAMYVLWLFLTLDLFRTTYKVTK